MLHIPLKINEFIIINEFDEQSLFFGKNMHRQHENRVHFQKCCILICILRPWHLRRRFCGHNLQCFLTQEKDHSMTFLIYNIQSPWVPGVPVIVILKAWWYVLLSLLSTLKNKIEYTHVRKWKWWIAIIHKMYKIAK